MTWKSCKQNISKQISNKRLPISINIFTGGILYYVLENYWENMIFIVYLTNIFIPLDPETVVISFLFIDNVFS